MKMKDQWGMQSDPSLNNMHIPRFHLAFPVHDLESAREFYIQVLGCTLGRESDKWIDFNFYGHQFVAHLSPGDCTIPKTNPVDGDQIPARRFGEILPWDQWEDWCKKTKIDGVDFLIALRKRFKKAQASREHSLFRIIVKTYWSSSLLKIKMIFL